MLLAVQVAALLGNVVHRVKASRLRAGVHRLRAEAAKAAAQAADAAEMQAYARRQRDTARALRRRRIDCLNARAGGEPAR